MLQRFQRIQILIQRLQLCLAVRILHDLHQGRRQGIQLIVNPLVGLINVSHQLRIPDQGADPFPHRLRPLQRGNQVLCGTTAAPGFRLVGLRHPAVESPHRRPQLLLQGIHRRNLHTEDATQRLIRIGIASIGERRKLLKHSLRLLPQGNHFRRQGLLMASNAHKQRAVAIPTLADSNLLIEEHIFESGKPLHYHTGVIQLLLIQLWRFIQQGLGLAGHHIALVRPELDLPAAIAFGQRAHHQRLQTGPGGLGLVESLLDLCPRQFAGTASPGRFQQRLIAAEPLLVRR